MASDRKVQRGVNYAKDLHIAAAKGDWFEKRLNLNNFA